MSYKGFVSHSKVSKEDQEFYDLKNKAAEYYRSNGVPQKIESVLNEMFWQKPDDIYGYLANYFSRLSCAPAISKITGREVFDGRGSTAVKTEVHCIIRNEEKMVCSAVMAGPCDGLESLEAVSNSDQQCLSNTTALKWIREHLSPMLQGFNPTDQNYVDKILRDFFMARYLEHKDSLNREKEEGLSNETVSEAPPQATPTLAPVLLLSQPIGVSDEGALQVGFEYPEQALDLVIEACANLALPLGSDLRLAINCAAHGLMDYSRGKYEVMSGCHKSPDELVDMYEGLINKYPAIKSLIDPFRKEDVDQWERLASVIGQSCCLIAVAASNLCPRWSDEKPLPPGVIIRHHNDMTISDLIQSIAEQKDAETMLVARSGDTSIVDLAVGSGVSFLKLGGLRGGERMDKYNRLMEIEEELEQEGILGAREKKQPPSDLSETFNSGSGCDSVTISAK